VRGHLLLTNCIEDKVTRPNIELALKQDRLLWLDLADTSEETLALLREVFKIHPLAIEDATEFHQRPKIEDYDDFVSIVAYGARGLASLLRYRTGAARAAADRWSHPADAPENG
jgi:magnesium transporter